MKERKPGVIGTAILFGVLLGVTADRVIHQSSSPTPIRMPSTEPILPGGMWITPQDHARVSSPLSFSALAYPTYPQDPPIDHVNFTADVNNVWQVACRVPATPETRKTKTYSCDWNIPLHANTYIKISFDVYDRKGHHNNAPNGEHTVLYQHASR